MPKKAKTDKKSDDPKWITRVIKFRVDTDALSDSQVESFERHAGTHRTVWNWALAQLNERERAVRLHVRDQAAALTDGSHDAIVEQMSDKEWRDSAFKVAREANPTPFPYNSVGFSRRFTEMSRSGEVYGYTRDGSPRSFGWWQAEKHGVNTFAKAVPLRELDAAVGKFISGKSKRGTKKRKDGMPSGWPTFKSKRDPGQFAIFNLSTSSGPRGVLADTKPATKKTKRVVSGRALRIPNIGVIRVHGDIKLLRRYIAKGGVPKSARFTQVADRWYVSINVSFLETNPYIAPRPTSRAQQRAGAVGVDLGVAKLAATSDREIFDALRPAREMHEKMAAAQRSLARMKRGSNRARKQRAKIARMHHLTALRRATAQHHLTKYLTTRYEHVVIEDLKLSKMTKRSAPKPDPDNPGKFLKNRARAKSGLNRSMLDVGMYEIRRQLTYKSALYGSTVEAVNPAYTSRTCSNCDHNDKKNRKTQADFLCVECGHGDDADINAAINIRERRAATNGSRRVDEQASPGDRGSVVVKQRKGRRATVAPSGAAKSCRVSATPATTGDRTVLLNSA